MVPLSDTYFTNLTVDAGPGNVVKWEQEISRAESLRHIDVSEMDIMASRQTDPSDVTNTQSGKGKAPTDWISLGVEIQDKQFVPLQQYHSRELLINMFRWSLRDRIRRAGRQLSESDSRIIDSERQKIGNLMQSFWKARECAGCSPADVPQTTSEEEDDLSDDDDVEDDNGDDTTDLEDGENEGDESDYDNVTGNGYEQLPGPVEYHCVPVPSSVLGSGAADRATELMVRKANAEHLLGKVREAVADRSFQYSHIIRKAPTKGIKTRARSKAISQAVHLTDLARQYNRSRDTMQGLGASDADLKRYQRLEKSDLKASTAMLNPNMPGSTTQRVGWIWQVGIDTADSPAAVTECKCLLCP